MEGSTSNDTDAGSGTANVSKEVIEAIHLLAQGKRNMMCQEVAQAAQQFQEACEILSKTYGDVADECGDAYYWYGKALLELSRLEGGVIGDAVPAESEDSQSENDNSEEQDTTNDGGGTGTDDDDDEDGVLSEDLEEDEEDPDMKSDADKHTDKTCSTDNTTDSVTQSETCTETKSETCEKQPENKSEELKETNDEVKTGGDVIDEQKPSTSSSDQQNSAQDEEDVSNLQLAWETLELAKLIYSRHNTRDMKLKLADTFLKLGEIGMETEQFDQSISDLTSSLTLLRSNLAPEDRLIAETLYQLGLACQLDKRYDDSTRHFGEAISVLESRATLQRGIVSGEIQPEVAQDTSDGFYSPQELAAKEIEEIAAIIPDIKAKIEDVIDEKRSEARVRSMMNSLGHPTASSSSSQLLSSSSDTAVQGGSSSCQSTSAAFSSSESQAQPVNNITHLIRKKRKEENGVEEPDVKRVCVQNGDAVSSHNGDSAEHSRSNGEASSEEPGK